MSSVLLVWDLSRQNFVPTSRADAIAIAERLGKTADSPSPRFLELADRLAQRFQQDPQAHADGRQLASFWGCDLRATASRCRSATFRLSVPDDPYTRQLAHLVDECAQQDLVVFDDEIGWCFLPDGTLLPEEDREMWLSDRAELAPVDEDAVVKPDDRTFLQELAGALFDEIGRGNQHR